MHRTTSSPRLSTSSPPPPLKEMHESHKSAFQPISFPRLIRQYTFTCEQDYIDIQEGYCPQYAIYWLDEQNKIHWPEGTPIRHRPEYLEHEPPSSPPPLPSSRKEREYVLPNPSIIPTAPQPLKKTKSKRTKIVRFDSFRDIIPIFDDTF